jgi:hypothetical protein
MTSFAPNTFITLHPVLKILDWDKFDAEAFATSAKEEPGCIYYGILKSQKDGLPMFAKPTWMELPLWLIFKP